MDKQKEERFCRKVTELKDTMYALSIGILKNKSDAEDAMQNAVFFAFKYYDSLSAFEKFKPWFLKILTVECYKIINKRNYTEDIDECIDICDTPVDIITSVSLWDAVFSLEPILRTCIILFYSEGMNIKDIAKVTNSTPDAVKKRLQRAREKLREILNEEDYK